VSAIVFLVDSADEERMEEAREELEYVLEMEAAAAVPVLVLGNKQDVEGAMGKADLLERLGLAARGLMVCI
jgi:ADP-ribosylation factor-like protein 8